MSQVVLSKRTTFLLWLCSAVGFPCCINAFGVPRYLGNSQRRLVVVVASSSSSSSNSGETTNADASLVRAASFPKRQKKQMNLIWCKHEDCKDDLNMREKVVGSRNQIVLKSPATGQVAYYWDNEVETNNDLKDTSNSSPPVDLFLPTPAAAASTTTKQQQQPRNASVYLLIKAGDDELMKTAASIVEELIRSSSHVDILLDPSAAARLKHYHGVDSDRIHLYEATPTAGYGVQPGLDDQVDEQRFWDDMLKTYSPDIICTLGGDGLLMHAGMMFQGPVPPILCVAGGSLGFLTPFTIDETVPALLIALGEMEGKRPPPQQQPEFLQDDINVFPPNMSSALALPDRMDGQQHQDYFSFGNDSFICLSIRMRLECSIYSSDGTARVRYNVLNEVVVDRGSSPYLAALECFCDDVHLTTVQADGVIFATPTGSTAYSLSAGSSVVHPSVPCILVTPICPHVLSFRPMVFPDSVVLRCYVPEDARCEASVAFDGKHRQELRRGESLQVRMSPYPLPTINRLDHSADWLGSLKRNFNFNARPRQRPL